MGANTSFKDCCTRRYHLTSNRLLDNQISIIYVWKYLYCVRGCVCAYSEHANKFSHKTIKCNKTCVPSYLKQVWIFYYFVWRKEVKILISFLSSQKHCETETFAPLSRTASTSATDNGDMIRQRSAKRRRSGTRLALLGEAPLNYGRRRTFEVIQWQTDSQYDRHFLLTQFWTKHWSGTCPDTIRYAEWGRLPRSSFHVECVQLCFRSGWPDSLGLPIPPSQRRDKLNPMLEGERAAVSPAL